MRGVEPLPPKRLVSKTSVATITPHRHIYHQAGFPDDLMTVNEVGVEPTNLRF